MAQKSDTSDVCSTAILEKEILALKGVEQSKETVLVIDDEESVVNALSEYLSIRGYDVQTALNSRQALGLVHEREFSIVVCDLRLPDMNGVELLDHVLDVDPETVFIIMTGYASVQSAVDALRKGAYDYVVKPFSMYELEKTMKLGVEKRRLAKENVELSHLMRKLIEIDQIKSNIISTVSHEFRTPLMSLKGYLTMISGAAVDGQPLGDNETKWLKAMNNNLGRLEMLILNLLLMTEANAGGIIISDDEIDLSKVIEESIARLDALSKTKEINIAFDEKQRATMRGDAEKIGVAITNLIENAIKFNMEDGRVEVGLSQTADPDGVRIAVLDTGIGIPDEKISTIFDSFTQVDMTHTRRFAGAGLGLPVAKAIVEAHGGRIDVASKPGTGSTFYIWLPRRNGGEHGIQ